MQFCWSLKILCVLISLNSTRNYVIACTNGLQLYIVFWTLARHVTFYLLFFQKRAGNMASRKNQNIAIPLCLPNNCRWNAATGKYIKTGRQRTSLYVVEEALKKLKTVKGMFSVHIFMVISFYITSFIFYICSSSYWAQWELHTCNHEIAKRSVMAKEWRGWGDWLSSLFTNMSSHAYKIA